MKALFLNPMPGLADLVSDSWPWERDLFRFQRSYEPNGSSDAELLDHAKQSQPDLIIYMGMALRPDQLDGRAFREWVPTDGMLKALRGIAPLVHHVLDGGNPGWEPALRHYDRLGVFSAQVNTDGCVDWPLAGRPNCMSELIPNRYPYRENLPLAQRPVDFGFSGGTGGPGHPRHEIVEALRRTAGLTFTHRPHFPERWPGVDDVVDYSDYFERMATYKVALSVAHDHGKVRQCKGRVLDAGAAGCCLLESANSASAHWFTPGVDYVNYETPEGAARTVKALLADLDWAQRIADNLHLKVLKNHTPVKFWGKVLELVGLQQQELYPCQPKALAKVTPVAY